MSRDLKRISIIAGFFLVTLRLCIGWQFLYEGLWKYRTQETATPWTASGYLSNAIGPFRDVFRDMADDPDGLNWLNYNKMAKRWESWKEDFASHYKLNDDQRKELDQLLHGSDDFSVELNDWPVELKGNDPKYFIYRPNLDGGGRLAIIKGQEPVPARFDNLRKYITEKAAPEYHEAVDKLQRMYENDAYLEQLETLLKEDPEWTGVVKDAEGNILEERVGKVELYRTKLAAYEEELAAADQDFEHEHLKKKWSEVQDLKKELIPPVKALDTDLKVAAIGLLSEEQRAMPKMPPQRSQIHTIDMLTIWALIVLGILLISGFFTRIAALLGAGMVLSFYLVAPPWPGVPAPLGPEHSFVVNKNLIEVVALLALTFLPTGTWFGVDGIFYRLFHRNDAKAENS
ncbi:DoxX family protein [Thalassoroseus pseudoceratinae]|uniref:DoxX family protein n=1 Tax=Thalassoroseus pseudoceratinae TaxID=2713176 RepID=UPI00141DAFE1|nr:DoxX family protein [Thalassoroseus pseudoceratinae]